MPRWIAGQKLLEPYVRRLVSSIVRCMSATHCPYVLQWGIGLPAVASVLGEPGRFLDLVAGFFCFELIFAHPTVASLAG